MITGFGRLGENFGANRFGVVPDMIVFAKAITNGVIPMGGVIVRDGIYDAIMSVGGQEQMIEFFHGYTYSGHPIATAAAHAVLDIFEADDLINRAKALEPVLENAIHSLKGRDGILDIRNFGLSAAVDLEPISGKPGMRALIVGLWFELLGIQLPSAHHLFRLMRRWSYSFAYWVRQFSRQQTWYSPDPLRTCVKYQRLNRW